LADLYREGLGTTRDLRRAAALYREAAEAGDANAQYNYGVLSAIGIGTTQNWPEAYAYLSLAAYQNSAEAKDVLTSITGLISPEDLAAGKQMVATKNPKAAEAFAEKAPVAAEDLAAGEKSADEKPAKKKRH
jgi:TPR repeat protein